MSTSISQSKPTTKVISLVLDSGPLIKSTPFRYLAQKFYTIPEVLNEIRDNKSREYVSQLPFELEIKNPSEHALKEVVNFTKKSGDFAALSAVDIRVLALTYMLEIEANGTSRIRKEPIKPTTRQGGTVKNEANNTVIREDQEKKKEEVDCATGNSGDDNGKGINDDGNNDCDNSQDSGESACIEENNDVPTTNVHEKEERRGGDDDGKSDNDSDGEWITPDNIHNYQAKEHGHIAKSAKSQKEVYMKVACMTVDYTMQGGRKAKNLVLREDQNEYQRALRAHQKQKKVDIFDPDYVPNLLIGAGPHATVGPPIIGYGRRNPNERRGRGKSNRKK
ncbi:8431_t:CDS:2 [Paraglomus occultum]|uniref:8431_t:CDS:1 n=1 Tax=Paraglomus occultum TaxID=144539 RepID=A0A9N9A3A4_9GLOM|nr:8431_t:CDS:2 [Paraglomus occultum]